MTMIAWLVVAAALAVRAGTDDAPRAKRVADEVYWIFLNSGTNKTPLDKDSGAKMQSEHTGNFGRLARLGQCLMAGPLGDKGPTRGIVVLKAPTHADVMPCFDPDPYVQNHYLDVEAHRWIVDPKKIHKPREPIEMKQYVLAVLKKGSAWKTPKGNLRPRSLEGWVLALKELSKSGDLAVSGPLQDAGDLVGVALFRIKDLDKVRAALDADASVKAGRVLAELHPLWSAAGVLGD